MRRSVVLSVLVTSLLLVSFAAVIGAQTPTTTVYACAHNHTGALRLRASDESCRNAETPVEWSATGPTGPQGPEGPQGPQGPEGPQGPAGEGVAAVERAPVGVLTIDGITTEAAVVAYEWGFRLVGSTAGGSGGGAGLPELDALVLEKPIDAATPELFRSVMTGRHHPQAVFELRDGGGAVLATYALSDVIVSGWLPHHPGSADAGPTETLTLGFDEIAYSVQPGLPALAPGGPSFRPVQTPATQIVGTLEIAGPDSPGARPVTAFSLAAEHVEASGGGGGGGGGRSELSDLQVTKPLDDTADEVFADLLVGRHFPSATLAIDDGAGATLGTIRLDDVLLSEGSHAFDGVAGAVPEQTLALSADQVTVTVGGATFCYDVVAVRAC